MLAEIIWNESRIAIALGCMIPIVAIVGSCWRRIEKTRSDNELKRGMIERGMSADEIERVLAAPCASAK